MDLKDVFEVLGIEGDVTSREQLVQVFNSTYVPIEKASDHPDVRKRTEGRIFGEAYGQLAKLSNGKYTKEDLSKKPFGEAFQEVAGLLSSEVESIKAKAGEGKAKREAELEKQIEDYKKSLSDYERDKMALTSKLEEVESNANQKVRSYIVGMRRKEVESKLPWKDGMTDLERAGLESYLQNNYRFDADESGSVIVKDKEGHTIPSPKKAGDIISLEDIYLQVGEKNNLFKKNNSEPQRQQAQSQQGQHGEQRATFVPRRLPPVRRMD